MINHLLSFFASIITLFNMKSYSFPNLSYSLTSFIHLFPHSFSFFKCNSLLFISEQFLFNSILFFPSLSTNISFLFTWFQTPLGSCPQKILQTLWDKYIQFSSISSVPSIDNPHTAHTQIGSFLYFIPHSCLLPFIQFYSCVFIVQSLVSSIVKQKLVSFLFWRISTIFKPPHPCRKWH